MDQYTPWSQAGKTVIWTGFAYEQDAKFTMSLVDPKHLEGTITGLGGVNMQAGTTQPYWCESAGHITSVPSKVEEQNAAATLFGGTVWACRVDIVGEPPSAPADKHLSAQAYKFDSCAMGLLVFGDQMTFSGGGISRGNYNNGQDKACKQPITDVNVLIYNLWPYVAPSGVWNLESSGSDLSVTTDPGNSVAPQLWTLHSNKTEHSMSGTFDNIKIRVRDRREPVAISENVKCDYRGRQTMSHVDKSLLPAPQ
jgi:hypothetical protein